MRATCTALARGIHLSAQQQSLTNAVAASPFVHETFRQLGPASPTAFNMALAFMDFITNREVAVLNAQTNGAAILGDIGMATPNAPAGISTQAQSDSLDRANLMLMGFGASPVLGTRRRAQPA